MRGNPLNTGEVLLAALDAGAAPLRRLELLPQRRLGRRRRRGGGDRELTNQYTRSSYPLGIVVNREGRRFVDEGADFRNYTYARYGREILAQPGGVAFQLFDATTARCCAARSTTARASPARRPTRSPSSPGARDRRRAAGGTISEFNAAVRDDVPFDAAVKDGRAAEGIDPPKSHWAQALDTPPFYGFAVTCGVTFTFGGLHIDEHARVLDARRRADPRPLCGGRAGRRALPRQLPRRQGLTAAPCSAAAPGTHAAQIR